jgi:hypothetical protein
MKGAKLGGACHTQGGFLWENLKEGDGLKDAGVDRISKKQGGGGSVNLKADTCNGLL